MSDETPLGKPTSYSDQYDPDLLFAIPRREARKALRLGPDLPFHGSDIWNAWELTWLEPTGTPRCATVEISVPVDSPNIVESKSLKLYLNSFSMSSFDSLDVVRGTLQRDLSAVAQSDLSVSCTVATGESPVEDFPGECIDLVDARCTHYQLDASMLRAGGETVSMAVHSHLLRSMCPVTGQPDIGSVLISYTGPRIDNASLLQYIVSYRDHNDYHEACVERMFVDISERCQTDRLTVYARYQRRGGIDINPFRSDFEQSAPNIRLWRQ
ncbi:MAG: NADPH-dependent 7-cyano-7-deazaguanine reductase QueF [Woeseiaceae bacterium]